MGIIPINKFTSKQNLEPISKMMTLTLSENIEVLWIWYHKNINKIRKAVCW